MEKNMVIYSLKMARYLSLKGHTLKSTAINIIHPQYLVYYFENTPELRQDMQNYKKQN